MLFFMYLRQNLSANHLVMYIVADPNVNVAVLKVSNQSSVYDKRCTSDLAVDGHNETSVWSV